jgi:hypothetical protein
MPFYYQTARTRAQRWTRSGSDTISLPDSGTCCRSSSLNHRVQWPTMPRTLFRTLAVALLILAIPVQGPAAINAEMCMAMGGHGGQHGHSAAAHDHDGASAAHEHEPMGSSQDQHSSKAHCPPCASCCATTAIAPTTAIVLPEAPPAAAVAAPQFWIAGVMPDSLDRPPLAL